MHIFIEDFGQNTFSGIEFYKKSVNKYTFIWINCAMYLHPLLAFVVTPDSVTNYAN